MNYNMENQQSNNKIYTYLLVIFFAAFVGSGVFLVMNNKKPENKEQTATISTDKQNDTAVPTAMPTEGFINLENNSAVNTVNSPVDLNLIIDSNGKSVTAFDTVISYDPVSFDFVSSDSVDPNFKVYSYKKDNRLTLTVVKMNQNEVKSIFRGEEVVKLVFQSKIKGDFSFAILPSFEKETTKFVNEKTEVIYPGVNEITVKVN